MNGCIGGIKEKAGAKSGVLASMPSVAMLPYVHLGKSLSLAGLQFEHF